jgi:menaquinol-cytochrome c reductase cytochrome b/c subunit
MAEEVEIDQEVYDKLIAEGKSERIARAKAKAAAVRAKKAAAGEQLGPREAKAPAAAAPVPSHPRSARPASPRRSSARAG